MNRETPLSGGCQCGAVRYRITGPLGDASLCHCRMCQKAFGNLGAPLVRVARSDFSWTRGVPATFRSSSIVDRGFCRDCGTPLFLHEDGETNIEIAVGTLDDPNAVETLSHHSGVESRVKWYATMFGLPEITTEADRTPEDMLRLKSLQHPDHDTPD
jgi:hypothetical protein